MDKLERLTAIAPPLLAWYDLHRRDLPWRADGDPYRVWVSEIMLQQTRVAAVIPYFERWMRALPTVEDLAAAEEGRVLKLWEGLGYYSRARNLQKAARVIAEQYAGQFPRTRAELQKLPGIGSYTAGAIASIAFGEAVSAVDGNVLRIAGRVADIHDNVLEERTKREVTALMDAAIDKNRPGDYNQALMDLGAAVCLPGGRPLCEECPLQNLCAARAAGTAAMLPVRERKAGRRVEERTVYVLLRQGQVALRQRPDKGLLAQLWEFPNVPGAIGESEAAGVPGEWGLRVVEWREQLRARHVFTHVIWEMTGYVLEVRGEGEGLVWMDAAALDAVAVPSAFARFSDAAWSYL